MLAGALLVVGAALPASAQKNEPAAFIVALPALKDSAVQLVIAALRETNGIAIAPRAFHEVTAVGARYEDVQPDNSIRRVTVTVDVSHKPVPNAPGVTVVRIRSWAVTALEKSETPTAVRIPQSPNAALPVQPPAIPRDTAWVSTADKADVARLRAVVHALVGFGGRVVSSTIKPGAD